MKIRQFYVVWSEKPTSRPSQLKIHGPGPNATIMSSKEADRVVKDYLARGMYAYKEEL